MASSWYLAVQRLFFPAKTQETIILSAVLYRFRSPYQIAIRSCLGEGVTVVINRNCWTDVLRRDAAQSAETGLQRITLRASEQLSNWINRIPAWHSTRTVASCHVQCITFPFPIGRSHDLPLDQTPSAISVNSAQITPSFWNSDHCSHSSEAAKEPKCT